ncbi:MAG TPA: hypothetical protein VG937_03400 [Polyangiaceae bacterium]|nr:hypothetical protein [Polyangiaceae bacterium]
MLRPRTQALSGKVVVGLLLAGAACAQPEGFTSDRNATTGGADGEDTGGAASGGGGTSSSGGSTASSGGSASGGSSSAGKGGSTTGGTLSATGGASAKGGATTGGSSAKGGSTSTGGGTAKGGSPSNGPPGTTLLSDDFEDQEAADWYAADMNGTRAVSMVDSGYAYVMTSSEKAFSVGGNRDWTNQRVEVRVKFLEAASSPVLYLMARWADAKSYVVIELRPGTTSSPKGDMKLRQSYNGGTSDICRYKPDSLLPNTWYTIGVSLNGGLDSTATLLFDGQPVAADVPCKLTKADPVAGGIALGIQSGSAAFDDVLVKVP